MYNTVIGKCLKTEKSLQLYNAQVKGGEFYDCMGMNLVPRLYVNQLIRWRDRNWAQGGNNMIHNYKKFIGIAMVLAISAAVSLPAFAKSGKTGQTNSPPSSVAASEEGASVNPLDTGKDILYYLFWTQQDSKLESDRINLQKSLNLSSEQMSELKALGLKQYQATDDSLGGSTDSSAVEAYNAFVETETDRTNQALRSILKDRYPAFRNWISAWWQGERKYRDRVTNSTVQ